MSTEYEDYCRNADCTWARSVIYAKTQITIHIIATNDWFKFCWIRISAECLKYKVSFQQWAEKTAEWAGQGGVGRRGAERYS